MGDEISTHLFDKAAYQQFQEHLESETGLLNEWLHSDRLNYNKPVDCIFYRFEAGCRAAFRGPNHGSKFFHCSRPLV